MESAGSSRAATPRDVFVAVCRRIAEPLETRGFRYRTSRNDITRADARFRYAIEFQPSIRLSSLDLTVHVRVSSSELAAWRREHTPVTTADAGSSAEHQWAEPSDVVFADTLAALTRRDQVRPHYKIATPGEPDRVVAEISAQIRDFALPFFTRFEDLASLVPEVCAEGFLPHRRDRVILHRTATQDFCRCFARLS